MLLPHNKFRPGFFIKNNLIGLNLCKDFDLLGKMLQIHPRKRINVIEALEHPFLKSLHNREHEHVAYAPFDFSFEDEKLHRVRLQELIWQEVGDLRPTCLPVPQRYYQ